MRKQKLKELPKPKAVRKTVVDFCLEKKISVRQFINYAKRTRLSTTKDIDKMETHFNLWQSYKWI